MLGSFVRNSIKACIRALIFELDVHSILDSLSLSHANSSGGHFNRLSPYISFLHKEHTEQQTHLLTVNDLTDTRFTEHVCTVGYHRKC